MLTGKERIQRILRHQPVDRIGLFEVFWRETAQRWTDEGHIECPDDIADHFGLDLLRTGGALTPGAWRLVNLIGDLDAGDQVVEETDDAKLVRNGNGALLRWRKGGSGAPEHVDFLVKDRAGWEKHIRPHLINNAEYPRRLNLVNYRSMQVECDRNGVYFTAGVVGAFDTMNELCGHENLLVGMAMDPDWICDMCDVYATASVELLEMAFASEGLPDGLWVWDDLGFKNRPFMSPAMYREIIFPAHKRLFDFAHAKGLPVILHTDGLIESLVPQLIEAGIDCLQPLEVKAGMDLLKIKRLYGDRIALIGGMDARELISNDLGRVRKELEAKLPGALAGSGYVLQVDHSVSHQVDYETYKYFVAEGLKIGTYGDCAC
jgi:uroporphyrinogen decarboxylase